MGTVTSMPPGHPGSGQRGTHGWPEPRLLRPHCGWIFRPHPAWPGHVSGIIRAANEALTANYIVPGVCDPAVARAVAAGR